MLRKLQISNYAIIDGLEVEFTKGLNIITGETGAGKSILVGALGLVLGDRAESAVLYDKQRKCIVEATFAVPADHLSQEFLSANDIEQDNEIIIRREIATNGKSRGFINDTPATLAQLKELAELLVDLHQQFDNADAGKSDFQRSVLDVFAKNATLLAEMGKKFFTLASSRKELSALESARAEALKEQDYNQFLFDELESLSLKPGELEDLDAELKMLSNAGQIRTVFDEAQFILSGADNPVLSQVKNVISKLQHATDHPDAGEIGKRLDSVLIELKDISAELESAAESVVSDPARLEEVNERIAAGYRMQKKHGVNSTNELLEIKQALESKLQQLEDASGRIEELKKALATQEAECFKIAVKIAVNRNKAVPLLEEKVNELLVKVGMPNARLKVVIEGDVLSETGTGNVSFLFNANYVSGGREKDFEPLRKVASGGELSRVMLILKSLVAKEISLPTLIFDEIDTGISGEASRQVGAIMKGLAGSHQVISVTHQPQIAARADSHFYVFKKQSKDRIITSVSLLNDDERVEAIAQMLGGDNPTDTTIRNAREMVKG